MNSTKLPLSDWVDAMAASADDLASTLGLESCPVVSRSEKLPVGMRGVEIVMSTDSGQVELAMLATDEGCLDMATMLLKLGAEEIEPADAFDAVGEIVNILAGGVKTRLIEIDPSITLGLPLFFDGSDVPVARVQIAAARVLVGTVEVELVAIR